MRLQADFSCGVLVVGTGLAGIRSAIAAAKTGQPVILCSAGKLFSGSSFYPGTWGLGLIGPDGASGVQPQSSRVHRSRAMSFFISILLSRLGVISV